MPDGTITGRLIDVGEEKTVGTQGKRKAQIIVETQSKYPQQIAFEVWNQGIDTVREQFIIGDVVKVDFHVNGREWQGKHYVNLRVANMECATERPAMRQAEPHHEPGPETGGQAGGAAGRADNLPF
jgi:hypothetical protein